MLQRINKALTDKIISRLYACKMCHKLPRNAKNPKAKGMFYINEPISFDIETTSFKISDEKYSIAYMWQMKIADICIYERHLFDFAYFINKVAKALSCEYKTKHIVVYVHYLGFEFQFIRKYFIWADDSIICNTSRGVIRAVTVNGIEFRCSLALSGTRLETVGKNLSERKIRKSKDLDYALIRHYNTPLTRKEMKYCEIDVKIVHAYIAEKLKMHGEIYKIPLTKTGYPRQELKKRYTGAGTNAQKYRDQMKDLVMSVNEYHANRKCFMGGFTFSACHARQYNIYNVVSYDINSSYPYNMVVGYYPVSNATIEENPSCERAFELCDKKCCLVDVTFKNISSKNPYVLYLMKHKCRIEPDAREKAVWIESRLAHLDGLLNTCVTEIDLQIISQLYNFDDFTVNKIIWYDRKRMPREMILALLYYYARKTELKGDKNHLLEYHGAKEITNSNYGMNVTDPCKDKDGYDILEQAWKPIIGYKYQTKDEFIKDMLTNYNKRLEKITWYPIGVYICAHARKMLMDFIIDAHELYCYSDTDSIKLRMTDDRYDKALLYKHNLKSLDRLKKACTDYNIPFSYVNPKTRKGEHKLLGQWDQDGRYKIFKTLGPKRYIYLPYDKDELYKTQEEIECELTAKPKVSKLSITCAGTEPYKLVQKLVKECKTNKKVFERFDYGLYVESEYTGKMTHTYIDNEQRGIITDYKGISCEFYTPSGIHLEPCDYELKTQKQQEMDIVSDLLDGEIDSTKFL